MNDCIVFKATLPTAVLGSVGNFGVRHYGTDVSPQAKPMTSPSTFFCWVIFGPRNSVLDYCSGVAIGTLSGGSYHHYMGGGDAGPSRVE